MGNFTSHHRHPHTTIENIDEHAARLMANLTKFREQRVHCDLNFSDLNSLPAHKLVVSFNQTLLELAESSSKTVAVTIEEDNVDEVILHTDEDKEQKTTEVNLEGKHQSSSVDPDQHQTTADDPAPLENDLVSELNTETVLSHFEEKQDASANACNAQEVVFDGNSEALLEVDQPENEISQPEELSPPLSSEITVAVEETVQENVHEPEMPVENGERTKEEVSIQIEDVELTPECHPTENKENNQSEEGTDASSDAETDGAEADDVVPPLAQSLTNPVDVLINFLYTSHIDITQMNVSPLRVLACQCGMADVITACDEFNKVLQTETECMNTNAEKDEVASKFRYRYSDPNMAVKMLQFFDSLRREKKYTNVIVRSSTGKVHLDAHSLILASGSNFFLPVVSNEPKGDIIDVTEIDEDVLESLILFLYTGKVGISSENVSKLLQSSDRMQLSDLIEGCAEFLESTSTVQNCIQHRTMAIDYKCSKLKNFIDGFISANFIAVSNTSDFMTLSVGGLIDIASNNDLVLEFPLAKGEMAVFDAVKRWIVHDEDNRKQHLAEVMSAVRFPLLSPGSLVNDVTTDILVMSNQEMCAKLTDVMTSKPLLSFSKPVSMRGRECILTVGGSYPVEDETSEERGYQEVNYCSQFTIYDPEQCRFHELTVLPETRALHCVAACDQFVFIVGGFDPHSCIVNSAYCFDLATGTWTVMSTMKIKRSCFSLHAFDDYLYAVGGLTPSGYTASVERLDRKRMKWEMSKPLPMTRYRHAGCNLNGQILISGGNDRDDTVMSYDVDQDSWNKEPPLNIGRNSHVMVAVKQVVYAIGGEEIPFSAECFKNRTWTKLIQPNFALPKIFLPGTAVLHDKIYMCGGWERENDILYNIRYYDTKLCKWKETNQTMPIPRGSAASCTIRIPKNYWKIKFNGLKA